MFRIPIRHLVAYVTILITVSQSFGWQSSCPPFTPASVRDTNGTYALIEDRMVTDSGMPEALRGAARNSSLCVNNSFDKPLAIGFESINPSGNGLYVARYEFDGVPICTQNTSQPPDRDDWPLRLDSGAEAQHTHLSLAMRKSVVDFQGGADQGNYFFAAWIATDNTSGDLPELLQFPEPRTLAPGNGLFNAGNWDEIAIQGLDSNDITPSAAMSGPFVDPVNVLHWEAVFSNDLRTEDVDRGLLRDVDAQTVLDLVRCCDGDDPPCDDEDCTVQFARWMGCSLHRDDYSQVLCWSEKEEPGDVPNSPFNVALRIYAPDDSETPVVAIDRDSLILEFKSVNEPIRDRADSSQGSVSCDIDPCGNIVVCWVGPVQHEKNNPSAPCTTSDDLAVYARRLYYDDTVQSIRYLSSQFRVDTSGTEWSLGSTPEDVHPTVAILQFRKSGVFNHAGRFIVAWNAIHRESGQKSVRGQIYHRDGRPWGGEFDLSPYKDGEGEPDSIDRTLAFSNQHTLVYGTNTHDQAFATYTAVDSEGASDVWFVRIPAVSSFGDALETEAGIVCLKGDVNLDEAVDTTDVQPFVNYLLDGHVCASYADLAYCAADTNHDNLVDGRDVQCMVSLLVSGPGCDSSLHIPFDCANESSPYPETQDCNENTIDDTTDISRGTSPDCNHNGIPDECEISSESEAEGGPWYCASGCDPDVNDNGIPDACETDCDRDGIPDEYELTIETATDLDENGVIDDCDPDCDSDGQPDAYEISEGADDCNENSIPDSCEDDCNENGVPDDCDIDPEDPDGDEWVSPDCNNNGWPDECDLSVSIFPSFDCNDNGIPDECDIADCENDPDCADCNENGVPDSCDIAASLSEDSNENGIPDECEEQSFMGGGGGQSMMGGGGEGMTPEEYEAALEDFFEWHAEQTWGPASEYTGAQQFQRYLAKLAELGLPFPLFP